ncbi:hypothetical protein CFP56_000927 [Quercus suber]|uniref:Uncharacterized protein n=1 Tax=Quercus suber TaxID=58331 RepID=A0AAW0INE8_QUESU
MCLFYGLEEEPTHYVIDAVLSFILVKHEFLYSGPRVSQFKKKPESICMKRIRKDILLILVRGI